VFAVITVWVYISALVRFRRGAQVQWLTRLDKWKVATAPAVVAFTEKPG